MAKVIDDLVDKVKNMLSSRTAFSKSASKQDLKDYLSILSNASRDLLKVTSRLSEKDAADALEMFIRENSKDKSLTGVQAYVDFRSRLRKDADKAELFASFTSIKQTLEAYIDILEQLEDQVDSLFAGKEINLFNTRLSHVLILGIIVEANMVTKFTKYLISALLTDRNKDLLGAVAPYRRMYLDENVQEFATVVTRIYSKTGAYNFEAIIKDMKTKSIDMYLVDDNNNVIIDQVNSSKLGAAPVTVLTKGIFVLDFFRWLGESWASYKHAKNQKRQTEKEWLESHVALLIMDLEEMDPDDREYKRLAKIIRRYESMINKLDRKIQKYEEKFA